jgi:hypothetical protein
VGLQGKWRLLLVAVAAIAVVGALAIIGTRAGRTQKPAPTATAASNVNGGTTATPQQIEQLKSYGLVVGELPQGTQLRIGEELRNYAAGSSEQEVARKGRIDGYYQVWVHTTAQLQFRATFDLYNSPASATAILKGVSSSATPDVQTLPDPKLGDTSRMYAFMTQQAGNQYQGWAVQWVRGRTLFDVDGLGPIGDLHADDVLNAARQVDSRAQKSPIK